MFNYITNILQCIQIVTFAIQRTVHALDNNKARTSVQYRDKSWFGSGWHSKIGVTEILLAIKYIASIKARHLPC